MLAFASRSQPARRTIGRDAGAHRVRRRILVAALLLAALLALLDLTGVAAPASSAAPWPSDHALTPLCGAVPIPC